MKTTTLTTLGLAALLVTGAFSNGCSSASTDTTGKGGSGGSSTGSGGTTGTGGSSANGGSTGSGGSTQDAGVANLPACASAVKDNAACTVGTDMDCNKTCGISGSGALKPCTCMGGTWNCGLGTCVYPSTFDKSCYTRPATVPTCTDPTVSNQTTCTPSTPCASSICSGYRDSSGNLKTGWCACTGMKAFDGGTPQPVWLCASNAEWPVP